MFSIINSLVTDAIYNESKVRIVIEQRKHDDMGGIKMFNSSYGSFSFLKRSIRQTPLDRPAIKPVHETKPYNADDPKDRSQRNFHDILKSVLEADNRREGVSKNIDIYTKNASPIDSIERLVDTSV